MIITETVADLQQHINLAKEQGKSVGLVPTMGALHRGHMELIAAAKAQSDYVVTTIFVNPTQFNNLNDLRTYPRTLDTDSRACAEAGVDLLFVPSVQEVYPEPDTRSFDFGELGNVMEGVHRPGHFNGVAQVVSRFFDIVKPNKAFFGRKDYQQLAIVRMMVEMLKLDVQIVDCPTVREADGLAMSSRNMLLTPEQRASAPTIAQTLREARNKMGSMTVEELTDWVENQINDNPLMQVEYFQVTDSRTLQPVWEWGQPNGVVACVAVRIGKVRLIDNIELE